MNLSIPRARMRTQLPLAALGKVTIAALAGIALMVTYAQVVMLGAFDPVLASFALVSLGVAGVMAVGWRWAPLLAAIWCVLMIALNVEGIVEDLTHPESAWFAVNAIVFSLMEIGIVGGIAATVQNYRSTTPPRAGCSLRWPRWVAWC